MLDVEKDYTNLDFELVGIEMESITSKMSNEDIFISVAKNIILNTILSMEIRIIQLISAIPRKEIVLRSIEQLYSSNKLDIEEYLEILEIFS